MSLPTGLQRRGTKRLAPTGGTTIPGVLPGVGGSPVPYGLPPFSTPGVANMPGTMPPSLLGAQVNQSVGNANAQALQGGLAGAVPPPLKRPRGSFNSPYGNTASPMAGRIVNPSMITNEITNLDKPRAEWKTGDRSNEFGSVTRVVATNPQDLSYAAYLKGQLVFNDTRNFAEAGVGMIRPQLNSNGKKSIRGITRLLPLSLLNYELRIHDKVRGDPSTWNVKWITPLDVYEQYTFDGTVRTDALESQHRAFRNTQLREYTVTTMGRDSGVTNVWGLVGQSQVLWLIIKRMDAKKAPSEYVVSAAQDAPRRSVPRPSGNAQYHPQPIQIIPWTDRDNRRPSAEDLQWFDEVEEVYRYGVAIRVGWVNYPSDAENTYSREKSWYDASAAVMHLPRVDVTVNTRPSFF